MEWLSAWVSEMTRYDRLPNKFFLHGHSYGGYLSGLYASLHPEKIAALFMNSAIGTETAHDEQIDPAKIRL